jgi:hypothetical protein
MFVVHGLCALRGRLLILGKGAGGKEATDDERDYQSCHSEPTFDSHVLLLQVVS